MRAGAAARALSAATSDVIEFWKVAAAAADEDESACVSCASQNEIVTCAANAASARATKAPANFDSRHSDDRPKNERAATPAAKKTPTARQSPCPASLTSSWPLSLTELAEASKT